MSSRSLPTVVVRRALVTLLAAALLLTLAPSPAVGPAPAEASNGLCDIRSVQINAPVSPDRLVGTTRLSCVRSSEDASLSLWQKRWWGWQRISSTTAFGTGTHTLTDYGFDCDQRYRFVVRVYRQERIATIDMRNQINTSCL